MSICVIIMINQLIMIPLSYSINRFKALYKGFVPKVLRLGPGGGILLVVFDQVTTLMRKHLDK